MTQLKWKTEGHKLQAQEHWDSFPEYVEGIVGENDVKVDEHPLKGVGRYN